jgi:predicted transcriptional regulator
MAKTLLLSVRIDPETNAMLEAIAKKTVRSKSDMFRFLVRKEYEQGNYSIQEPGNGKEAVEVPCSAQ